VSLRAVGEGHISCVEFRTGVWGTGADLRLDPAGRVVEAGTVGPAAQQRHQFGALLGASGADAESSRYLLSRLPPDGDRRARRRRRVDRHRQLDAAGQLPGQRVGDQRPQPGFQLLLDEVVGRRDQRGVLHQAQRPGQLKPCSLVRLDLHVGKIGQGPGPYICEVVFSH